MLGERQWQWLERQLETPAEVRLIGSSVQVLADFPGWEGWSLFARDQQRLIELIRRKRADGVVFLSGDMHYAELSKLDVNVPYPLWDLTSSGLTVAGVDEGGKAGGSVLESYEKLANVDRDSTSVTICEVDLSNIDRMIEFKPSYHYCIGGRGLVSPTARYLKQLWL